MGINISYAVLNHEGPTFQTRIEHSFWTTEIMSRRTLDQTHDNVSCISTNTFTGHGLPWKVVRRERSGQRPSSETNSTYIFYISNNKSRIKFEWKNTKTISWGNKTICYEAYVKSKFRYKIYLAMNDVTSTLYVSLVRQFETLLFYVVSSRIEALVVSRHKFLNACVEKVYRLLFFGTRLAQSF